MTSKNNTSKAVDETIEGVEAEASVPQQKSSNEKVTVLKGGGVDGKDMIVVSDELTTTQKFKNLLRNKKVIAGLSAFATVVVIAVIRSVAASSASSASSASESDLIEPSEPEDDTNI